MKIQAWSLTPLKEGPSTLIQLPTCKQRSLISKSQDVWFNPAAQVLCNHSRHSSISPQTWQPGTEGFTSHHFNKETHHWRIYPPHLCTTGFFFFYFFFVNGHPSPNMATHHRSPGLTTGTLTIWQPASGGLSVFSASALKYHTKTTIKPEGRKSLRGKI